MTPELKVQFAFLACRANHRPEADALVQALQNQDMASLQTRVLAEGFIIPPGQKSGGIRVDQLSEDERNAVMKNLTAQWRSAEAETLETVRDYLNDHEDLWLKLEFSEPVQITSLNLESEPAS